MISLFTEKEQCCGCNACAAACPKKAITMSADEAGFVYPLIDGSLCVECGVCKNVCAFKKSGIEHIDSGGAKVYAAYNRNGEIHRGGSSGGVFAELARRFVSDGGAVYGAAFDKSFCVRHIRADNLRDAERLTGSKYVQSDPGNTFEEVLSDLKSGKKVLFSGTGCQIDGLKGFLKKDYDSLYTVDIVCRGVPSPKMFDDYKAQLERRYSSKLKSFSFRAKKIKGEIQDVEALFENGKRYSEYPDIDNFRSFYSRGLSLRPSCYSCKYACAQRVGDITLGDFWGLEKTQPDFKQRYGNSLVIVSTQKGRRLFDSVSGSLNVRESKISDALQPSLTAPVNKPEVADEFMSDYLTRGFDYVCGKYNPGSRFKKLGRKLKSII